MRLAGAALAALFAFVAAGPAAAKSPWTDANPDWIETVEPFRVYGDVYFVGSRGLSSFLITTPEGHFLLDGGLPENAAMIADNIGTLGFDLRDVKILLNSHAHFDHSGGLAALKRMTGAKMVASEADRAALEGGFYPGSEDDKSLGAPPVDVDQIIGDGETLTLGGVALTAHLTPGHTKGCTSWTMRSGDKEILFFCSATVAANRLVSPPQYPGIVEDYRSTFAKTASWAPDIFLSNHPGVFDMDKRRAGRKAGDADAFVDRAAFQAHRAKVEAAFEAALAEQIARAAAE